MNESYKKHNIIYYIQAVIYLYISPRSLLIFTDSFFLVDEFCAGRYELENFYFNNKIGIAFIGIILTLKPYIGTTAPTHPASTLQVRIIGNRYRYTTIFYNSGVIILYSFHKCIRNYITVCSMLNTNQCTNFVAVYIIQTTNVLFYICNIIAHIIILY